MLEKSKDLTTMPTYTSLSSVCQGKMNNYSNLDTEWIQFVKDHRRILWENSTTVYISPEMQHRYRYSLSLYLYDNGIDQNLHWMILWLNQIHNECYFNQIASIRVPTNEILQQIYSQYASNKAVTA